MKPFFATVCFFVFLILAGCGGGGGASGVGGDGDDDNPNTSPQTSVELKIEHERNWVAVNSDTENTLVLTPFVRSQSDLPFEEMTKGDIYWTLVEGNEYATLEQKYRRAEISAKKACPDETPYCVKVQARIETSTGDEIIETVSLLVKSSSENIPVQVNAGLDQTVNGGDLVILDGSASTDLDGQITSWEWRVKAGKLEDSDLIGTTTAVSSFYAPQVNEQQLVTLELVVTDDAAESVADTVVITIEPVADSAIAIINIERPQDTFTGQQAILVGTIEPLSSSIESCEWQWNSNSDINSRQRIGEPMTDCSGQLQPVSFIPEPADYLGDIYITLVVHDSSGQTAEMNQKYSIRERQEEETIFTVSTQPGEGVVFIPEQQPVLEGENQVFWVVPVDGYLLDDIDSTCGGVQEDNRYITAPVHMDCMVSASYRLKDYQVDIETGANGQIIPSSQQVEHGKSVEFDVVADEGYRIDTVTDCQGETIMGNNDTESGTYSTGAVTDICTFSATFVVKTYPIEGAITGIIPPGTVTVTLTHNGSEYVAASNPYNGYFSFDHQIPFDDGEYTIAITELPGTDAETTHNCQFVNASDSYSEQTSLLQHDIPDLPSVNYEIVCAKLSTLNDTGINTCADSEKPSVTCPAEGYPGLDAEFGRDKIAQAGLLKKKGSGTLGFDYSKVCNSGELAGQGNCPEDPVPGVEANEWGCSLDNRTGLMWEVKMNLTDISPYSWRNSSERVSWYSEDSETNGGFKGKLGHIGNTQSHIQSMNQFKFCGRDDWRLPTRQELLGTVGANFFPNTYLTRNWTSNTVGTDGYSALTVDPRNGYSISACKYDECPAIVRAVSGEASVQLGEQTSCRTAINNVIPTTPTAHFTDHGDGTVTHQKTGLMWMRCSLGQIWDGEQCTGTPLTYDWQHALLVTQQVNIDGGFAGYSDWRVPNLKELESITELGCYSPTINETIFPDTPTGLFWTSSNIVREPHYVWGVDFDWVKIDYLEMSLLHYVRLVRTAD